MNHGHNQRLMRDVTLNAEEEEECDNKENIFEILLTLNLIETALGRDSISQAAYVKECRKLLSRMTMMQQGCGVDNLSAFAEEYKMNVPLALRRIELQEPASFDNKDDTNALQFVMATTETMLSIEDAIQLEDYSIETLRPEVQNLVNNLSSSVVALPQKHVDTLKIWGVKMSALSASDEIDEEEGRQLGLDVREAREAMSHALKTHSL
eukprot:m.4613 g.4613  ORF g.4613 m.4613 type:complete len:209 (+) comp3941_c0_seq1:1509-2135(+)